MDTTPSSRSILATAEIRIVRLNTDKTRMTLGSTTVYQVYFELSEFPPIAWRDIFGREWKQLMPAQTVGLDGKFLVIHCPLQDVATMFLPALKKALDATNKAYKQYDQEQEKIEESKADAWKTERQNVEEMAKMLKF